MRYYPSFRMAIPHFSVDSYVLLTRLPLSTPRKERLVRLACLRHTASVHPEPGSNSQKKFENHLFIEAEMKFSSIFVLSRFINLKINGLYTYTY
jgi:hypothetical protein